MRFGKKLSCSDQIDESKSSKVQIFNDVVTEDDEDVPSLQEVEEQEEDDEEKEERKALI